MKNNRLLRRVCNPRGLEELAPVQVLPGHTPPFQRAAVRWFKTGKVILVLTGGLAASSSLPPSLHAAVYPTPTFTAGTETVVSGSSVSVPITVTGFSSLAGAQFTLTWDTGVLTLQPTPVGGLNPALSIGSAFGTPSAGTLTWLWYNQAGATVAGGTAVFSVQFTATGAAGTSSAIMFGDTPTLRGVSFADLSEGTPITYDGRITVVPEPVNWALGLFACVFIGSATVRWISRRQTSLQSL